MLPLQLLYFENLPIFKQLQIEEALLRADDKNWCLVNHGSPPAIVMGISGRPDELINEKKMQQSIIPLIRRFSGGGTVIVDEHTSFYTLVGNRTALKFPCYPEKLLQWTEELYAPAFDGIAFSLQAQDYTIADRKFGGNAQYITKDRWLHHSSFLWDYRQEMMDYLLMPPKIPSYRQERSHSEFLCKLKDYFPSKITLYNKILVALQKHFDISPVSIDSLEEILERTCRRSTTLL